MQEITQQTQFQPTSTNSPLPFVKKVNIWKVMFVILFLAFVTLAVLFFIVFTNQRSSELVDSKDSLNNSSEQLVSLIGEETVAFDGKLDLSELLEQKTKSDVMSFPLVDDTKIVLVPIQSGQQSIKLDDQIRSGGGASGYGSSEPKASPDLKIIAYLDHDSKLHLLSADGEVDIKISDELTIDYISGWSSDSNRLIFHAFSKTLQDEIYPEYGEADVPNKISLSKSPLLEGFYLLDIDKQNLSDLSVLGDFYFESWIDESRILIQFKNYSLTKFAVVDLDTYVADLKIAPDSLQKDFGSQYVFSKDGSKWALTWHGGDGGTNSAAIILADFPSVLGNELMKADFAQIQGPTISPDGKKVAFRGYDFVNGPLYVYLYDGDKVERVADGFPIIWVDNSKFIYLMTNPTHATNTQMGEKLFMYDIESEKSAELYEFSKE